MHEIIPSSLLIEQAEQRRWKLRSQYSHLNWFDQQILNEFISADEHHARQSFMLRNVIGFAVKNVPYYHALFSHLGLSPHDILNPEDLSLLPVLTRTDVQQHAKELQATRLPPGHKIGGDTRTSGTTGQPVQVRHTLHSLIAFTVLRQRELRWFRVNPTTSKFAAIRPSKDLPRYANGQEIPEGTTCHLGSWTLVGRFFKTGPFVGYSNSSSLEDKIKWLDHQQPDYLLTLSADLEHLALGYQDWPIPANLGACQCISQQLTVSMRRRIENTFGVPVYQNYGLNEFGIVGTRCPEGGRYHIHPEHSLAEIVDEQGQACQPGQRGRLLLTTLANAAMPLIRYDTGDLAEAVDGPCPCGRTLPSFATLQGRYRRTVYLPPGTWDYWDAFLAALDKAPVELTKKLRQYQLHQYKNGTFELKLVAEGKLPLAFLELIHTNWQNAGKPRPETLTILEVDNIPRPPGGKFQDFVSDFVPESDTETAHTDQP